ncbi:hypothetical protein JCM11641_007355 [Rhodosporidiobolus odoratus]
MTTKLKLLDLPPEILITIFSQLSEKKAGQRAICKQLLPLTRRNLFRCVVLASCPRSNRRISNLTRTIFPKATMGLQRSLAGDRHLGLHVRELHLPLAVGESSEGAADEDISRGKRILRAVKEVEVLSLDGSTWIPALLPKKGEFRLPRLGSLSLELFDTHQTKHYDMVYFSRLRRFSALEHLAITLCQADEASADLASPVKFKPLLQVKHLELTGGLSLSSSSASNFISHFTHLDRLDLTLTDLAELSLVLEAAPTSLTSLSIEFDLSIEWEPGEPGIIVDQQVSRFTQLTNLTLGENTFSSALFPILTSHLPSLLTLALTCGEFVELDASKVLAYLHSLQAREHRSPSPSPSSVHNLLKEFDFDAFYVSVDLIPSQNPDRPMVADGTMRLDEWWSFPHWTREFSYHHAKEIVCAAEAAGVELKGSLLEAIETEELKRKEERYLLERQDDVLMAIAGLFEQSS